MSNEFHSFANGTQSADLGGLTVENGEKLLTVYGDMNISRDEAGLAKARALMAVLKTAVDVMTNDMTMRRLPAKIEAEPSAADAPVGANPFA